jgi:hypothetical protein
MAAGTFSTELSVFQAHRDEWRNSHPGEFVAIQDDVVVDGFFGPYGEALKAGLREFGVRREFLVKQVWMVEPLYCVS